jgi:glucose-6-phosphate isomerase
LLALVTLERTLFLVVSKSGSTAETMAQYLIVRRLLQDKLGDAASSRLVFLTDPERGALRQLARTEGIRALDVPPNVGGRFSVLSAVGLFPALLTGIDAGSLLRGAAAMRDRCSTAELLRNPAGMYAALQWLADTEHGARIHVFMPYSDALRDFAHWFVQLWAESLGKFSRSGQNVGPTPLPAVGATDQHSQVQLFMEGPHDKTVTFVSVGTGDADIGIPTGGGGVADLAYLGGSTLGQLLDVERRATAGALAARGRPNMTIELPAADAYHVGELIMLLEFATVVAGQLYDVDAMNQPGVELGKNFTYALMGRKGSESSLAEWRALPQQDPARRV